MMSFPIVCRRLLDEEDELAEAQPDAVPSEVREWLASTFTRNLAAQKPRTDDKPKFRSVANAIRAGIMVDRYLPPLPFIHFSHYSLSCQNLSAIVSSYLDSYSNGSVQFLEGSLSEVVQTINMPSFAQGVDEWSFDVFTLNHICSNKVLRNLSAELLSRYGLIHKFKV